MDVVWIEITDEAEVWRAAGFNVADDATFMVGPVEHRLTGKPHDGAPSGVIRWGVSGITGDGGTIDGGTIDGIATVVESPSAVETEPGATPHPNGVFRIDHLVVRTSSTPRTAAVLSALGAGRRGGRSTNSAGASVDMTFFWAGDTLLEVVGPPQPSPDGRPASLAGIAYATDDLDGAATLLGSRLTTPVDAVQKGRRIAAFTPDAGSTARVALMTPHVRSDA